MPTSRLPLRVRAGVALVIVALVAAIGAGTAAVQVGAAALRTTDGNVQSVSATDLGEWAGYSLANRSPLPVTLHAIRVVKGSNVRVLATRVVEPVRTGGFGLIGEPLPPELASLLAESHPVEGFVLPPHSTDRFQLIVQIAPRESGRQAVLAETAITFSVLGLDHGFVSHAVQCIRAPGRQGCPPY